MILDYKLMEVFHYGEQSTAVVQLPNSRRRKQYMQQAGFNYIT